MTGEQHMDMADGRVHPNNWERRRASLMKSTGAVTLTLEISGGRSLPLAYARRGPRSTPPVLVIPGGPGLGSLMPYQRFRTVAAKQGLDVLMVEHRGVGLSRKTTDGIDLRPTDITTAGVLADLIAVLDAEDIEQACVYGASYGSYVATAFGARYPERVSGMILDSPMLGAQSRHETARSLNALYWHGTTETSEQASRLRALIQRGTVSVEDAGFPIQLLHESGGPDLVTSMLNLLERGKGSRAWSWLNRLGDSDVMRSRPFLMEFDLVAHCAFTELGYGLPHDLDLGPLSSDDSFAGLADQFRPFESEPVDARRALSSFDWPVLVLSGDRDVRTPRAVAEQVVSSAPHAVLVPIKQHGHSALDTAQPIALQAIRHLSASTLTSPHRLSSLRTSLSMIARWIAFRIRIAKILPKSWS